MADLIQIKRGDTAGAALSDGELGYSRTEKALYIGDNGSNVKLTGKMEALEELATGSSTSAVVSAYNSLIAALKSSGLMKEGE